MCAAEICSTFEEFLGPDRLTRTGLCQAGPTSSHCSGSGASELAFLAVDNML